MVFKGFGRKRSMPNRWTILAFAWGPRKITKPSVRTAGVPAEIGSENLRIRYLYELEI
jgi:hypothetical protein